MGVAKVTFMRGATVDFALVEGVRHLIGEHACRQTRDDLFHVMLVGRVQYIIIDEDVIAQEGQLCMPVSFA